MKNLRKNINQWSKLVLYATGICLFFLIGKHLIGYWIFCALPIFVSLLFVYVSRKSKELNQIQNLLFEACDPNAFIGAWERYDKNKKTDYLLHLAAHTNISLGYFYKGDIKRGISHLISVNDDNTVKKTFSLSYAIYYNLAYMYLFDEQLDQTKLYLDKQKQLIADEILIKGNPQKVASCKKQTEQLEKVLNIKENRLDGVLEYFLKEFEDGKNKLALVSTKYYLFLVYEKLQNLEAQYECMEFIKENGKHLFLTDIANSWLESH